jgi:hypothetical protein
VNIKPPLEDEEVWEWAAFLEDRWEAFAREKNLPCRDGKALRAFMAGGYAVLEAILELEKKRDGGG